MSTTLAGRKRASLSPADLPLKKRCHAPAEVSPATTSLLSPLDFSLPNRTRAKVSPGKCSHTDTESPSSEHSLETSGPRPLDLSTDKSPVKPQIVPPGPSAPPFWASHPAFLQSAALLQGSLLNPLLNPLLAGNPDLLKLLIAASSVPPTTTTTTTEETASTSAPTSPRKEPKREPEAEEEPSEEPRVINPATGNKVALITIIAHSLFVDEVRRNYKNMTRERRMEANARERTRVHTIGAAFDALQRLVPSLAPDQKLSKLSILRIGCKYILLLAAMSGKDYSSEQCGYSVAECVEMLNETIAQESKVRRLDRR